MATFFRRTKIDKSYIFELILHPIREKLTEAGRKNTNKVVSGCSVQFPVPDL